MGNSFFSLRCWKWSNIFSITTHHSWACLLCSECLRGCRGGGVHGRWHTSTGAPAHCTVGGGSGRPLCTTACSSQGARSDAASAHCCSRTEALFQHWRIIPTLEHYSWTEELCQFWSIKIFLYLSISPTLKHCSRTEALFPHWRIILILELYPCTAALIIAALKHYSWTC